MGGLLLVIGLFVTGGAYAAASTGIAHAQDAPVSQEALVEEGEKLFLANCASCHGMNSEGSVAGPSLIGVGALSVDFQVGTGRMPMAASGPQAEVKPVQFTQPQIDAMAAEQRRTEQSSAEHSIALRNIPKRGIAERDRISYDTA